MGWYSESDLDPQPNATPTAAIIGAESSGNPNAVSKKGARGLMQIMPATAKGMGVDPNTLFDPKVNVGLGSKLYQQNLKLFNGDKRKALAAYNWGPGNVKLHPNESDWPKETQGYVNKIAGPREPTRGHWVSEAELDPVAQGDRPEQQPLENTREYQARLAAEQFKQQRAASGQTIPQGAPTAEQEALQQPAIDPVLGIAGGAVGEAGVGLGIAKEALPAAALTVGSLLPQAEKHPYAAAAAVGALTPPGWAVDALGAAGGAAVGVAEQEAYMGIADAGMKLAGPDHPYVGLGIGALGTVLGGGAMSLATGSGRAASEARAAAAQAKTDFWEAAQKGATDQMAKNVSERADAAQAVADEAKKRHEAIQTAYKTQAEKNLKATAPEHGAAAAKLQAYADQLKAHADAIDKHGPAAEKLAREQAAKAEIERQRPGVLGRTPEETQAAMTPERVQDNGVSVPNPEQLARTRDFRGSFFNVRKKIFDHYGQQYQDFENNYGKLNVQNPAATRETLDKWRHVLQERQPAGAPPSAIKKLMDNASALAGSPANDSFEEGRIDEILQGRTTPSITARLNQFVDKWNKEHPELLQKKGEGMTREDLRRFAIEAAGGKVAEPATITKLRALRRDAQQAAESATDPTDARMANEIAASAAKDYEHAEGLPQTEVAKLQGLNAQYSHDVSTWSPKESSNIMSDREPANVIDGMVKDPDLMDSFASNATDDQKLHMRNSIADWANTSHYTVAEAAQKVTPKVMTKLGFKLPPKAWMEMEPRDIQLNEIIRSNPMAQHAIGNAFSQEMQSYEAKLSGGLRTRGIKVAEDLGPQGKALAAQMRNAVTPEQVRAVAQKIAAIDPKQVAAEFAKGLQSPQSAAYEKYLEIAQEGRPKRQAFQQQVAGAQDKVAQASLAAAEKVPTRAEAGRKALMNLKPGKMEERMQRYSTFRIMLGLEMSAGMGAMTGHVPAYWVAGGVLAGAMKVPLAIRGATRAVLSTPEVADFVWKAVEHPHNYQVVGKSAALALQALMAQHIQQKAQQQEQQDDNQ